MLSLHRVLRSSLRRPIFYYTKSHEYLNYDSASKTAKLGLTSFAQSQLGDIVHLDLPEIGKKLSKGQVVGVVESVKTVADIYAPVAGTVLRVNDSVKKQPELVNTDPESKGWVAEVTVEKTDELQGLLTLDAYKKVCAEEQH